MRRARVELEAWVLLLCFTSWCFRSWVGSKVGGAIVGLLCGRNYFRD